MMRRKGFFFFAFGMIFFFFFKMSLWYQLTNAGFSIADVLIDQIPLYQLVS